MCLWSCCTIQRDLTHVDTTDWPPSLPTSLQNHNYPLLGILKNTHRNKMTDLSLISSYHGCFCFLLPCYLFLYWVAILPVTEDWWLNSFPSSTALCIVSHLDIHISIHTHTHFWLYPHNLTFLSEVFISWYGIEVATEATGAVGIVFGQCQGDVGCIINCNSEAKLFTPEFVKAELRARKHGVRCIGQRQPRKEEKRQASA